MKGPKRLKQEISKSCVPLENCLAKTLRLHNGVSQAGVNVETHCRIVGTIAQELISRMPKWFQKSMFPDGSSFLSAAHDVGKISPTFQEKIRRGITDYEKNTFPGLESVDPDLEKDWGYHAGISQASVEGKGKYIPDIVGKHHGYSPNNNYLVNDSVFGGPIWQQQREELFTCLSKYFKEVSWPKINNETQASVLAGLTTVSDWIGSGPLFDDPGSDWEKNIKNAVDSAGFLYPEIVPGLSFYDIFGFQPYSVQQSLLDVCGSRGLYVLEAPMGIGKTEAALYAAYKALESDRSRGIYFALPTQLTSNKIWERMKSFLEHILTDKSPHREALLLHGNAWLHESIMGLDAEPGMSWFNNNKRGILAPFAVGTIDQALMSVMNVKHGFVRTFGLAGKVVILDEVHTYDSYTGTIMDFLIKELEQIGCTVIILSATLTRERLNALLGIEKPKLKKIDQTAYPLVSFKREKETSLNEVRCEKIEDVDVKLQITPDDDKAIEEALAHAEQKEQILWIENTVDDAQKIYKLLAARAKEMNINCGLIHSRFTKTDREKNETLWVGIYGKDGIKKRQEIGRILVGTQVLEQSLDIDADLLFTRICPTDMILQRIGRLWRHRKNDSVRPKQAERAAWILAPCLKDVIADEKLLGKSMHIYPPYILCRTLEVCHQLKKIRLPGQIRSLIEDTYFERDESGDLAEYKNKLEKKRDVLRGMARIGISMGGKTQSESKAATRYSEIESTEVLLVREILKDTNGTTIKFLNGSSVKLPKRAYSQNPIERQKIAAQILLQTVSVPYYTAPDQSISYDLKKRISDYVYMGHKDEDPIRIALVNENGIMGMDHTMASSRYKLDYTNEMGYISKKIKEK